MLVNDSGYYLVHYNDKVNLSASNCSTKKRFPSVIQNVFEFFFTYFIIKMALLSWQWGFETPKQLSDKVKVMNPRATLGDLA